MIERLMKVRRVPLGSLPTTLTRRPDGTMIVRTTATLGDYPMRATERLVQWAERTPRRPMLAWRGPAGAW